LCRDAQTHVVLMLGFMNKEAPGDDDQPRAGHLLVSEPAEAVDQGETSGNFSS
jgi:phosphoribosyl-AMP cyclohydrolase